MYGPYSEELTLRIEELCEMGFLKEQRVDKGSYIQYQYNVSPEGERFLEKADKVPSVLPDFIQKMQVKSSRFLELVSTLLYFDQYEKKEQIEKVQVVKNKLKFSETEFEEAFNFINDLARTA